MRTSLLLAAVWLVALAAGSTAGAPRAPVPAQATNPDAAIAQALNDLSAGRVFEAVESLSAIVEDDPSASAAYFYLSVIYTDTGQLEMAREFLERALEGDPAEGKFHYQLGVILLRDGDRVAALSALETAIDLGMGGDEAAAWRNIGDVQALLLEREAAFDSYQKAVVLEPANARNQLALGQFFLDRNESEGALTHLRQAVELDPTLEGTHVALGLALQRSGNVDAAVQTLRRGVEINPFDQKSRYALAQSLMAGGREDEAMSQLQAYSELEARIAQANATLDMGSELFADGNLVEARPLLEEAILLAPTYSAAHQTLGEVLLAAGEPQGAVAALEQAAAVNPLSAGAHFSLGAAWYQTGQFDQALEATRRAIVLDAGDARYRTQLGDILLQLSRDAEARTAFAEAARIEQESVD